MHHKDFMEAAIKEAQMAKAQGDLPFGAVVIFEDRIVGSGKAENNTTGDVTDHAELLAIRNANKILGTNDLSRCTIYCTNEPCIMCAAGIFQAGISKVFIGVSRDDLPKLLRPRKIRIDALAQDSGHRVTIERGLLKKEILSLFADVKK